VDLALENVDFVEANSLEGMQALYKAWNCGYRVVASAGDDAVPNFYRSYILGSNRAYVHSGPKLDYDQWIAAFRAGRSFVSSGPLIFLKVNGKEPGDEISLPAGSHNLDVQVDVESIMLIVSVDIVHNGKIVETIQAQPNQRKLHFSKSVRLGRSGWISVQTRAQYGRTPIRRPYPFAATMPVWIIVGGQPVRSRVDTEYFIEWMDRTLAQALALPAWNNEKEREQTRLLYAEAKARMRQRQ